METKINCTGLKKEEYVESNSDDSPTYALLGDEIIELHESMYNFDYLCDECKELGYCKKKIDTQDS